MTDFAMGDAPPHRNNRAGPRRNGNNNRNQNNNNNNNNNYQNNNRNQMTCNICNRPGHVARDCRSNPNGNVNGNVNTNRNANRGNAGNNANNNNFNNANGGRHRANPDNTKPNDQCYMHPRSSHSNAECTNPMNVWSTRNPAKQNGQNNGQQQQQPQQQQNQNRWQNRQQNQQSFEEHLRAVQQAHYVDLKNNFQAIPGADCNYCERCNKVGHLAASCSAPAVNDRAKGIACLQCWNHGHDASNCKHPAFCGNCRTLVCESLNNPTQKCPRKTHVGNIFRSPISPEAQQQYATTFDAAPQAQQPKANPIFGFQPQPNPQPQAAAQHIFSKNSQFSNQVSTDTRSVQEYVIQYIAQQTAEKKRLVEAKFQRALASYPLHLSNDFITQTERQLCVVDPSNPKIKLSTGLEPTAEIETLCKKWIDTSAFAIAAAMIRSGFNFFRDPRALGGLHRAQKPVCLTCKGEGVILDAAFYELRPGHVDVSEVADYMQWGVSVVFSCGCCRHHGFTWVGPGEVL